MSKIPMVVIELIIELLKTAREFIVNRKEADNDHSTDRKS